MSQIQGSVNSNTYIPTKMKCTTGTVNLNTYIPTKMKCTTENTCI